MANTVAVIVPVYHRPQNAVPFMRSILLTTDDVSVYAVADEDDPETAQAWADAGATVLPSSGPSFAIKVNDGYRATTEPWLFVCGDDVAFHPGWKRNALGHGIELGAHVIGTNDMANSRVVTGQHATHFFVRRSYVDEQGASWDGPGVVCHEGYRHWYVDDELITVARLRGVFYPALCSVVEHLHPMVGKAADDEVYQIGKAHAAQDGALWESRARAHGLVG